MRETVVTTRPWITVALPVVAIALAAFTISVSSALSYHPVSIYDEGVHFDYIAKLVDTGRLPPVRGAVSAETLKELSCRPTVWNPKPTCSQMLTAAQTPLGGINYVAVYPPVYYAIAASIAAPIHAITGLDLFMASRLASGVLFALGAALVCWTMLRLKVDRLVSVGLTLAIVAIPAMVFPGSTVTPDSMSLLFGSAAVFVVTLPLRWRTRMLVAVIVAAACALSKANFVPLATAIIVLAGIAPERDDSSRSPGSLYPGWRRGSTTLALAVLPVVLAFSWNAWRMRGLAPGVRADGGLNDLAHTTQSLPTLIEQAGAFFLTPLLTISYSPSAALNLAAGILQALLLGGAILVALMPAQRDSGNARVLSIVALGALALLTVFIPTVLFVLYHSSGANGRYALPLVPIFAATIAGLIGGRGTRWAVILAAIALYSYSVYVVVNQG
jgi:hypothetical protein